MWWFIVVVAVLIVAIWLIDRRRGSTGASRADDLPSSGAERQAPDSGFNMPFGGGGDGGF